MPTFSSSQIPPPKNWQDFETLCRDLWEKIWNDPNTQKNGRQGQQQHGVDVYGRPNQGKLWVGVQCREKDYYGDRPLTEKEVREEVEKAKSFEPKLFQFTIATTSKRDEKLQEIARKITENHKKRNLFSVHIWTWRDIVEKLAEFPELIEKHFFYLYKYTRATPETVDFLKEKQNALLEIDISVISKLSSLEEKIDTSLKTTKADLSIKVLASEYNKQIDYSKDLLNTNKPETALSYLKGLKERLWHLNEPILRFRILTNMAASYQSMNQYLKAANLFIEALQYNPDDEKALCNAALGYLLINQSEEANSLIKKVLSRNPSNTRAYSLLVQTFSDAEELPKIMDKIPVSYRKIPEVAYAISYAARKRNDFTEAEKWLTIAVENDKENTTDIIGSLGEIKISQLIKNESLFLGNQITDDLKNQILKAIEFLTIAWNSVKDTELRKFRLTWIINRGLAKRLINDFDGAIKDIEIALLEEPLNPKFIKHRAILAYESGDNNMAVTLLKDILDNTEVPETELLLADILKREKRFAEALEILTTFIIRKPKKELSEAANRMLIQLYIAIGNFNSAKDISNSLRASNPTNVYYIVDSAQIARFSGKISEAISILQEAKKHSSNNPPFKQLLQLANEFYYLEQFEDSISIYEKIVDPTLNTPLTHKLLNSYYRSGKTDKAFEICRIIHKRYGPQKYISEIESSIYEEIGNLEDAKKVCQEFLTLFPKDVRMKLRLAIINYRSNKFEDLDKFLREDPNISSLPLESCVQLAYLYSIRNFPMKSFEIIYEARRKYYNVPEAHLNYISCLFQTGRDNDKLLNIKRVEIDTAVCIENNLGEKDWYVIENRDDSNLQTGEINLSHPLTRNY